MSDVPPPQAEPLSQVPGHGDFAFGSGTEISVPADSPPAAPVRSVVGSGAPVPERTSTEQLARIEDKTARIEEKFARSEAAMQRVVDRFELASTRMSEVALQSDLAAVRTEVSYVARKVRNLPGLTALALTAIATAVLTAVVMIAILRFLPALLPR